MDTNELLKAGIRAVKSGDNEEAKQLLLQVIQADDKNERAWLWLSGAVSSDEERRICLENVLTINPDNKLARKGLTKLEPAPPAEMPLPPSVVAVSEEIEAVDAPDDDRGWWSATDTIVSEETDDEDKIEDVWSSDEELCAYCATPVTGIRDKCPECRQELIVKTLINDKPTQYHGRLLTWMIVYLSLRLIGVTIVFLSFNSIPDDIRASIDLSAVLTESLASIVPLIIAIVGVYQREMWAYWLMMIIALGQLILVSFLVVTVPNIFVLVCISPLFALSFFILYSTYMAGGDFKTQKARRIAVVAPHLKDPVRLDRLAQKLAKDGRWATAVLHWQRAVAHASGHAPYLLRLGHGYAEIGFYERSLDTLKAALNAVHKADVREKVEKEIVRVTRLSQADASRSANALRAQPASDAQNE